jgi:hypothetical protein
LYDFIAGGNMSLPLQALNPNRNGMLPRTSLNLPACTRLFPFRKPQREALELALSNSPIAAIAGIPGSGKTEVGLGVLATAIAQNRSTLVVASSSSHLERYTKASLAVPLLWIENEAENREIQATWRNQQRLFFQAEKLPLYWCRDPEFEREWQLENRQFWLDLSRDRQSFLERIKAKFPNWILVRQQLLARKLQQAVELFEEQQAPVLEEVVQTTPPFPLLCSRDRLNLLNHCTFDLVIVEDSHCFERSELEAIAAVAQKLVILGELTTPQTPFSQLFNRLFPAYRLELTENHRLHPQIANAIFLEFYDRHPYTPLNRPYTPLNQRLVWRNVVSRDRLFSALEAVLADENQSQWGILAFSLETRDRLRTWIAEKSSPTLCKIEHWQEWTGQECESLWIVCDRDDPQPTEPALRLSLTRARDRIVVFGDRDRAEESAFQPLLKSQVFQEIREIETEFESTFNAPIIFRDRIPLLFPKPSVSPHAELCIDKGSHRGKLETLIAEAQQFLCVCSYRLEDENIVAAIAQKAQDIPVWILTDFSNEVWNRVDPDRQKQATTESEYAQSDRNKQTCLRQLREAGIGFRSGNFHLKTYISEQTAYFGSCNLTGGSLDFNQEAGVLWHNTPEHQFLIDFFHYLWNNQALAQILPTATGFRDESLVVTHSPSPSRDRFLSPQAYPYDLTRELQQFARSCQGKIRIYTRAFNPKADQLNLFKNLPCEIFSGSENHTPLPVQVRDELHAKVILIGDRVAYLGSKDCAFNRHPLIDLTYKTTDPQEIDAIAKALNTLH